MTDPSTLLFILNIIVCADGAAVPDSCAGPARFNHGPYATEQDCVAAVPLLQQLWPRLETPARYAFECFGVRIR